MAGRVEEAGSAGGVSEALGRQRAEPDKKKKKIKAENIPCLYFRVARVSRSLEQFIYL